MKKLIFFSSFFFALGIFGQIMPVAQAAEFDPSYLISDSEMVDYNSMTQDDIKRFLEKRNGTLENYLTFDKEGAPKTAVQSFYEISQRWLINPKYLLVLTQKEQSLLEDANPSQKQYDWATGYGVCDNCGMDDPSIQRFKGFYRQVNSAAAQTRYYMDNIKEFNFQPDKTSSIDGQLVKIKNTATAGLYNYTPHLHGNQNFWSLWNKYFGKKWPDGSLLQAEDSNNIYYLENGQKRLIASKAILASRFDAKKIIAVAQADIDSYDNGPDIKYLNFALLQNSSTKEIFMIMDDVKRKIASEAVFKKMGFNEDELIAVTADDLKLYRDGNDITEYTIYPTGVILQDSKAKKPYENLYYVISGEKKPILTKEIFDANFAGFKTKKVTTVELDTYMTGDLVTLPDGYLVKTKKVSSVYVISNGKRLPIFSGDIFKRMGYNSKNVKVISDETLEAHELGQTITGDW
jgi:hypothetical protein